MTPEREMARKVYRTMLESRILEAKLTSLYKAGKIVGGVYLGKGHEAVSATLGSCLIPGRDLFAPLIRDQAGRLAFGEPAIECARTYLGSVKGPTRGRDGNVHRGDPLNGIFAMISHLGASVSVVDGALLARRLRGELDGVVGAISVGEGATSTGAFHEGLNLAAIERLPLVALVANNQYAYSTPNDRQFACEDLTDRAKGYGVEGHSLDGTDFLECLRVIGHAVERARSGHGPQMIVAKLLRLSGHGEHDDSSYISEECKRGRYGRDCLEVAASQMRETGYATETELEEWKSSLNSKIVEALAIARQEPKPDPWKEDWRARSVTLT